MDTVGEVSWTEILMTIAWWAFVLWIARQLVSKRT
jgi:hypothetical protein